MREDRLTLPSLPETSVFSRATTAETTAEQVEFEYSNPRLCMDVIIAVEDGCCRIAFERYAERAGLNFSSCLSIEEFLTTLEDLRRIYLHRPLLVLVGEVAWLKQLHSLPHAGRVPYIVDTSGSGVNCQSSAKLLASCTQNTFEELLDQCAQWWTDLFRDSPAGLSLKPPKL
ncbi:unnamed protein product [Effrenium voratum]|uniref:Uncharacterized protein n=1 Tax=Effrenium voratum TaxID=2562239 RepID=A0AA36ICV6_9DINO|nr:unnamed protein product [Effrenium voratum]CAJ1417825.1 unnamed protein product [Effrenium voratum]